MLNIHVDEEQAKEIYIEEVRKKLQEFNAELVFWDSEELCKRTCMSFGFIKERFFFDPKFPKHKVGGKWLFPAAEAKAFLLRWLAEQPKS